MFIRVKVVPNAKKESFTPEEGKENCFIASVREKAERNRANTRVRELVAGHFGVSVGKARLISGHHTRTKMFSVAEEGEEKI
ncbi:MAG: DUF167 domain-containing protein [Patescibacteria group bacterium]